MPDDSPPIRDRDDAFVTQLYDELRRLARGHVGRMAPGQTIQATALVHEAWLKLAAADAVPLDRDRFAAAAAQAMRHVMIDRVRARHAQKRGGGSRGGDVDAIEPEVEPALPVTDLLTLDSALRDLEREHSAAAELVMRRFFGGETMEEIAAHQGTSLRSLQRTWAFARAFLVRRLGDAFLVDER